MCKLGWLPWSKNSEENSWAIPLSCFPTGCQHFVININTALYYYAVIELYIICKQSLFVDKEYLAL